GDTRGLLTTGSACTESSKHPWRWTDNTEYNNMNSATHGRWWRHCTESQQNTFGGGQTTLNITACMFQTAFPSTVFLWCDVCQL
ncbi:mCG1037163, partial [Mus musculus]